MTAEGPVFLKEKTHSLGIYGCIPQSSGWIAGTTLERQPVGPFPSQPRKPQLGVTKAGMWREEALGLIC